MTTSNRPVTTSVSAGASMTLTKPTGRVESSRRVSANGSKQARDADVSDSGLVGDAASGGRDQVHRHLHRLVLVEPVLGDQLGEDAGVDAPGRVVTGRDGAEGTGVVDEAGGAREPGRLHDR